MARAPNGLLFGVGLVCMLIALTSQTIPLASQRYAPALLTALGLTIVADACLGTVAWRGGLGWRVAAVIIMLPTWFIILDFLRRAPSTFS
jgi:hypothetical protein